MVTANLEPDVKPVLIQIPGSEDRISDAAVISSASSQPLPWPASSANGHSPSADHRNGSNENLNNIDSPPVTSSQSPVTSLAATAAAKLTNGMSHHSNGVSHHSNGDLDYMEKLDGSSLETEKRGKVSNPSLPRDTSKKSRDSSKMTKEDLVINYKDHFNTKRYAIW